MNWYVFPAADSTRLGHRLNVTNIDELIEMDDEESPVNWTQLVAI